MIMTKSIILLKTETITMREDCRASTLKAVSCSIKWLNSTEINCQSDMSNISSKRCESFGRLSTKVLKLGITVLVITVRAPTSISTKSMQTMAEARPLEIRLDNLSTHGVRRSCINIDKNTINASAGKNQKAENSTAKVTAKIMEVRYLIHI